MSEPEPVTPRRRRGQWTKRLDPEGTAATIACAVAGSLVVAFLCAVYGAIAAYVGYDLVYVGAMVVGGVAGAFARGIYTGMRQNGPHGPLPIIPGAALALVFAVVGILSKYAGMAYVFSNSLTVAEFAKEEDAPVELARVFFRSVPMVVRMRILMEGSEIETIRFGGRTIASGGKAFGLEMALLAGALYLGLAAGPEDDDD